jgi:hypothetical protein
MLMLAVPHEILPPINQHSTIVCKQGKCGGSEGCKIETPTYRICIRLKDRLEVVTLTFRPPFPPTAVEDYR